MESKNKTVRSERFSPVENGLFTKAARAIVEEITQRGIHTVVLAGRSAKNLSILLREAWRTRLPSLSEPRFFSMANLGEPMRSQEKRDFYARVSYIATDKAARILQDKLPSLVIRLSQPLLLLDEHVSDGGTLTKAEEILRRMGAKNVTKAVLIARLGYRSNDVIIGAYGDCPSFHGKREVLIQLRRKKQKGQSLDCLEHSWVSERLHELREDRERLRDLAREV